MSDTPIGIRPEQPAQSRRAAKVALIAGIPSVEGNESKDSRIIAAWVIVMEETEGDGTIAGHYPLDSLDLCGGLQCRLVKDFGFEVELQAW